MSWRNKARLRSRAALLKRLRPGKNVDELLDVIQRAEAIPSEDQRQLLERFINFHDLRVREIMTPSSDIKSLDMHCSVQQASEEMLAYNLVRMPVIDGSLDRVIGVIHIRKLFSMLVERKDAALQSLTDEPMWVSELEKATNLLERMRSNNHVVMVRDEFGGTAGLATFSDLLEEIFSALNANSEQLIPEIVTRDKDGIVVSARIRTEDLAELLSREGDLPEGDFDTLGGLVITSLGRIPQQGDKLELAGMHLTIKKSSARRIEEIHIQHVGDSASV